MEEKEEGRRICFISLANQTLVRGWLCEEVRACVCAYGREKKCVRVERARARARAWERARARARERERARERARERERERGTLTPKSTTIFPNAQRIQISSSLGNFFSSPPSMASQFLLLHHVTLYFLGFFLGGGAFVLLNPAVSGSNLTAGSMEPQKKSNNLVLFFFLYTYHPNYAKCITLRD